MMAMMHGDSQSMGGAMLFFGLIWLVLILLFITVLVLIIIASIRFLKKNDTSTKDSRKDIIAILDKRYAKGEFDEPEYERLKKGSTE